MLEFPSLMFIRKIPFHSFRRQRIRHWLLLLLRCAAHRPSARGVLEAVLSRGGSGCGDHRRPRGRGLAGPVVQHGIRRPLGPGEGGGGTDVVDSLGPEDLATIIFFDSGAEAGPRSTTDRVSIRGMIQDAELGSGTTRFGPALKLAEGVFEDSDLPRLEAVLVSDFQRSGVESATGVRFPQGTVLTPIAVTDTVTENAGVAGVIFEREYFSGRERGSRWLPGSPTEVASPCRTSPSRWRLTAAKSRP